MIADKQNAIPVISPELGKISPALKKYFIFQELMEWFKAEVFLSDRNQQFHPRVWPEPLR